MMSTRPLVSVIVPTHNRASSLHEALDSIHDQEGCGEIFDLEVIVVDDASTDNTAEVVTRYPVRYVRHAVNRGLAASRNTGISACKGHYIALLDDDTWLPAKLRIQVPVLEAQPEVGLVYSSYKAFMDDILISPMSGTPVPGMSTRWMPRDGG